MSEHNDSDYQSLRAQAVQAMAEVTGVCEALQMKEHAGRLGVSGERLENRVFSVGVMGEFRRGKSTVINALLGREIVPSDVVPTSATLNCIRWGEEPGAQIHYKDGTQQSVPVEALARYVTKIDKDCERVAQTVDHAVVFYPCPFCKSGVEIVDTPGLNDDEHMNRIAEEVIPRLDAIIMVLVPDSPLSVTEAEFVSNKMLTGDLGRVIFVLNKIDQVRPQERQKLIDSIRKKICETVLGKQAAMYGEDSDAYKQAKEKLAGVRLIPLSARDALEGRLENDDARVRESGVEAFEAELSRLLTRERGPLEMIVPVNAVLSVVGEARAAIALRRRALDMEADELEAACQAAMEKLAGQREIKRREVEALRGCAAGLCGELLPEVERFYAAFEESLNACVREIQFTPDEMKNEKRFTQAQERVKAELFRHIEEQCSAFAEKLVVTVHSRAGADMAEKEKAIRSAAKAMYLEIIGGWFDRKEEESAQEKLPVSVGELGSGAAGALGSAAGIAASIMLKAVIGTMMRPFLPIILIVRLASTIAGKAAATHLFNRKYYEKKAEDVRAQLYACIQGQMDQLRSSRTFETWLEDIVSREYDALAAQLDHGMEATISGLEGSVNQMRLDMQQSRQAGERIREELDALAGRLDAVYDRIFPVHSQLIAALGNE